MHCNTVTTFKVGKLSQNSMPNLILTFHSSCMFICLMYIQPWPKIWIQLLLLLSKIFIFIFCIRKFDLWQGMDLEDLWTSLYLEFSVFKALSKS